MRLRKQSRLWFRTSSSGHCNSSANLKIVQPHRWPCRGFSIRALTPTSTKSLFSQFLCASGVVNVL
jgi:hypothetical protein